MNPLKSPFVQRFLNKRVSPIGLSLFRIAFCMIIMWEVCDLFYFRHLIFDYMPYQEAGDIHITGMYVLWFLSLSAMLVGWQTRMAAAANFACSMLTFSAFHEFEYHFDHVAHCCSFMLLFLPVSETLSVDSYLKNRRARLEGGNQVPEERGVHPIYYYSVSLIGIGLVYIESFVWKLTQPSWIDGYGIWRPMSLPPFTHLPSSTFQFILNQEWMMKFANYLTLTFEFVFVFLMWSRRIRFWVFFPLGMTLHLGIMLAFPIPKFSLAMFALYLTVVPPDVWEKVFNFFSTRLFKKSRQYVEYTFDAMSQRISNPNRKPMIALTGAVIIIACLIQCTYMLETPFFFRQKFVSAPMKQFYRKAFGICPHGVFLDHHWKKYERSVAIVQICDDGTHKWLPYTTESGQAGILATDRMWVNWTFRANSARINNPKMEKTLQRVTAFWLNNTEEGRKNEANPAENLKKGKFLILAKVMEPFTGWKVDQLKRHCETPWQYAGEVTWQDGKCTVGIETISKMKQLKPGAPPFSIAKWISERSETIRR